MFVSPKRAVMGRLVVLHVAVFFSCLPLHSFYFFSDPRDVLHTGSLCQGFRGPCVMAPSV